MKTFSQKPADVTRKWYVMDASEAPLGRIATVAASLLIGKGKPTVTSHVDGGDYVVVINADKLVVTGNKLAGKMYYNYSGFPSGLRQRKLGEVMAKKPTEAIERAIYGMIPANKLRQGRMDRLKVYVGGEHPHAPQTPETVSMKGSK